MENELVQCYKGQSLNQILLKFHCLNVPADTQFTLGVPPGKDFND